MPEDDRETIIALRARREGHQIASEIVYPELERPIPAAEPAPPLPPEARRAPIGPVAFVDPRELARHRSPVKLPSWLCHAHDPIRSDPDWWQTPVLWIGAIVLLIAGVLTLMEAFQSAT
jgi:hypothetical protein